MFELLAGRGVTQVEGHAQAASALFPGFEDGLNLPGVHRQRLFAQNVQPGAHRPAGVIGMAGAGRGDDQLLRTALRQHPVKLVSRVQAGSASLPELRRVMLQSPAIGVAQGSQLSGGGPFSVQRVDIQRRPTPRTDQSIPPFSHPGSVTFFRSSPMCRAGRRCGYRPVSRAGCPGQRKNPPAVQTGSVLRAGRPPAPPPACTR